MKPILLVLTLLLSSFILQAQRGATTIVVKGKVVDSATQMGMNATVMVVGSKSVATDSAGGFTLAAPAEYVLHVTAVGYQAREISGRAADLGKIALVPVDAAMQGAVVTASRHVVKQEIDRISYDVQADPDSKANDALEMLRKVPMVTVDANDIVQLKGSTNFQIFINGKPSALMVASPSDVLKAMPAATIQKIEVITVPPSKFDGEGLAGIINIITLKSTTNGVNGSLFARYNSVFGERGSASVNVSEGRFSLTGLLGLGRQPQLDNNAGLQLTNYSAASGQSGGSGGSGQSSPGVASVLTQQGDKSDGGHFNNGKADLSFELDSNSVLTGSGDFFNRRFTQTTSTYSTLTYPPDSLGEAYRLLNAGPVNASALDGSVGYQVKFGPARDGSLNVYYRYASTSNNQGNTVTVSDGYHYSGSDYTQSNSLKTRSHNIELNLIRPSGRIVVEAGGKAILGTNESDYSLLTQVNDFSYHQDVYSVYNSYELKLTQWEFKAGVRLENTTIGSSYTQNTAAIHQNYLNPLPAVSVQRYLAANSNITLGYTQRIQRATATQLNPFVDQSNPSFIVTGNPALRPVLNNIVQLDYSRSSRLSVNASFDYTFSNDPIQNVTGLISDTVSESTYENVGKNQSAGLHLTLNYPLFSNLNLIVNSQLSHLWIAGTYNAQYYKNDGNQGNVAASARYTLPHFWTATINYNYKSGNVNLQGKSSGYTYVGFNVIKEFWRRRATLSVTAFSPWRKIAQYSGTTKTPDFEQYNYGQFYDRNFRFAFNYKFGRLRKSSPRSDEE
jgi:hypothetical protein